MVRCTCHVHEIVEISFLLDRDASISGSWSKADPVQGGKSLTATPKSTNPQQVNKYTRKHSYYLLYFTKLRDYFLKAEQMKTMFTHPLLYFHLIIHLFSAAHMKHIYQAHILSSKTSFGFYLDPNLHYPSLLLTFLYFPSLLLSLSSILCLFLRPALSLSICQGQQSAKNRIKKYSNVELVAIAIHTGI